MAVLAKYWPLFSMSPKILRQNIDSEHKVLGFHRVTPQKLLYACEKKMKSFCQFMTNSILVAKKSFSSCKSGTVELNQIKWGQKSICRLWLAPFGKL